MIIVARGFRMRKTENVVRDIWFFFVVAGCAKKKQMKQAKQDVSVFILCIRKMYSFRSERQSNAMDVGFLGLWGNISMCFIFRCVHDAARDVYRYN